MTDPAAHRAKALAEQAEARRREGRFSEAEACYREALALEPTAARLHSLAFLRQLAGDYPAAETIFRQALTLNPGDARTETALGLALLAQGRFAEGFRLFDSWRRVDDGSARPAPEIGLPQWSGEDVAGKNVVVVGEEGFGDQIMYARFALALREAGANVGWVCLPGLVRLVRDGLGMEAIGTGGQMTVLGADYAVPTSRLPVVFMQRLAAPPPAPYLRAPAPNLVAGLRVGVVARGNPEHPHDCHRSLPTEAAAELMALPGAVSLAPEDTGARDFWDTAAVIAGLDLVISVDTAAAHLAGALGKPCWLLLSATACDWRWGPSGATTPWYRSMRLFRQVAPGDWRGVVAAVKAAFLERP